MASKKRTPVYDSFAKPIRFNSQKLVENLTVKVVVEKSKWFDLRMTIGLNLIKLGAFIAGLGYEKIEGVEND